MKIATKYDGTFELFFLNRNERIGKVPGTNMVEISSPTQTLQLELGDWIVRASNGLLFASKTLPPNTKVYEYDHMEGIQ